MPIGGLLHYQNCPSPLACVCIPLLLFSASLSLAQLGGSLTEFEFGDTGIRKILFGRVIGYLPYNEIEKAHLRQNMWCFIKGGKQKFFLVPKMNGYEECVQLLGEKLNGGSPSCEETATA